MTDKAAGNQGAKKLQRYDCAFVRDSGCPFTIRTVEHHDNTWEIHVADLQHNDHTASKVSRGLPKHLKVALRSAMHGKSLKELQALAAEQHQQVLTFALRKQIQSFVNRERRRGDGVNLPAGQ